MPKVSVIIPVYNTKEYLAQCLDSVINQTLEDIEIICIDDASADDSLKILNEYSAKDRRIRVLHNEISKSALGARKKGVMEATGEYIMFLDSDDYYSPDACEIVYGEIRKTKAEILCFESKVVNCANVSEDRIDNVQEYIRPYEGELIKEDIFDLCFADKKYSHNLWNKIYDAKLCKEAFEEISDIYMPFAEDLYTYFIIADKALSYIGLRTKPLYYYCYGRGITQTDIKYTINQFEKNCQHAKTIKALKDYCLNKHPDNIKYSNIIKNYYNEWIIRSIRILYNSLPASDIEKGEEIIYSYWGKDEVLFMKDKFDYIQSRKSISTTVQYIFNSVIKKGLVYTIKVLKY